MKTKPVVKVESNRGMLRLSIPIKFYPKRYYYLGLPDLPEYRIIANQLSFVISIDCAINKFDFTLEKYQTTLNHISLIDLWHQYSQFKKIYLAKSSLRIFGTINNHLSKIPIEIINNAPALKVYLVNNLPQEQARRVLMQLNAACNWGVEMGFIANNPFKLVSTLKKYTKKLIDPFSEKEKHIIINSFKENEFYNYYSNFVEFLFLTGCRPSEAIGLTWEFVSYDLSLITFKNVIVEGHHKDIPKNRCIRHFPVNYQLKTLLEKIPKKSEYLFLSKEGENINLGNFTRRAWHGVFKNLNIRYRPPYNTRHTFITLCINKGVPIPTIANWCGNSSKVIFDHYAGLKSIDVPII
jgi:integrase